MAPSCVAIGQLANRYGLDGLCMWGAVDGLSLRVPSLASVYAISIPITPKCAHSLCM